MNMTSMSVWFVCYIMDAFQERPTRLDTFKTDDNKTPLMDEKINTTVQMLAFCFVRQTTTGDHHIWWECLRTNNGLTKEKTL